MPSKADTAVARTIGIDTGKNTLHMIGLDEKGAIVLREKVSRTRIATRLANVPPCLIGIEAGMASHHVARELVALGHEVKQVPPAYSKPFRQGHKNDFRDAHAVAEAAERPSTRCVPIKTDGQLDLQALHRVRSRLISNRTAVINQILRLSLGARHPGPAGTSLPAKAAASASGRARRCAIAPMSRDLLIRTTEDGHWKSRRALPGVSRGRGGPERPCGGVLHPHRRNLPFRRLRC